VFCWLIGNPKLSKEQGGAFLEWSLKALDLGKKYLKMGYTLFLGENLPLAEGRVDKFWEKMGLRTGVTWVDDTYRLRLLRTVPEMIGFERKYPDVLPGFMTMYPNRDDTKCFLEARGDDTGKKVSCLIAVSETGGFVADGYGIYYLFERGRVTRKWYLNPFLFFAKAFGVESLPKLDTTTLNGRRIYYSLIDGDGWNNDTELSKYPPRTISAIVLYDKILKKYPDLPVTVGPIGADIDPSWVARRDSQFIAQKMFALPHIEMGSHTFTHPFDWNFFKNYDKEKEVPFLHLYPNGSWRGRGVLARITGYFYGAANTMKEERVLDPETGEPLFDEDYTVPRAFALKPFDLELEVSGSIDLINTLSRQKEVTLYQWSGNCVPFYEALKAVYRAGVLNMNGGDTRFDSIYASYGWVAPLGREVDGLRQVYSSNANENIYTKLWTTNFFGFNLLPQTFKRTETPIRVNPMCLYYHVYSLEKNASLEALEQNIEFIQTQEFIPIRSSRYADLVMGFYEAEIEPRENSVWGISGRRSLQTVRFDEATLMSVDEEKSKGVIGHRYFQGSLYLFLDPAVEDAAVAVKNGLAASSIFSLIQSRWNISHVKREENALTFKAEGFGRGEMAWRVPEEGAYEVTTSGGTHLLVPSKNRQIELAIPENAVEALSVTIKKTADAEL